MLHNARTYTDGQSSGASVSVILDAVIGGPIWSGDICTLGVSVDLLRERARIVTPHGRATLRDVLDLVLMEKGGDFRECSFLSCSTIMARTETYSDGRRMIRERRWDISRFPSVADLVDLEMEHALEDA